MEASGKDTKKQRCQEAVLAESKEGRDDVDRLSLLPDALLLHIMSFLQMEDVVPSTVLSKRWRSLWVNTGTLDFTSESCRNDATGATAEFTDRCLILHKAPKITSFMIRIFGLEDDRRRRATSQQIDSWVSFAVARDVEKLYLDCIGDASFLSAEGKDPYMVPHIIFRCCTIVNLTLVLCNLSLPSSFCLSSLKTLELQHMSPSDAEMTRLITSCPNLENLSLYNCHLSTSLGIYGVGSCLSTLKLSEWIIGPPWNLITTIFVPSLRSLHIEKGPRRRLFHIANSSSLDNVSVDSQNITDEEDVLENELRTHAGELIDLLIQLCRVKQFKLCSWSTLLLSFLEVQDEGLSPPFDARNLELDLGFQKLEGPGVGSLLRCFSRLENLTINVDEEKGSCFKFDLKGRGSWESMESSLQVSLQHLKVVKIYHSGDAYSTVEDLISSQENEISFLAFLLKKLPSLESLTIFFKKGLAQSLKYQNLHTKFASSSPSLPRASENVQVNFILL